MIALLTMPLAGAAQAGEIQDRCILEGKETGRVAKIIDGETIVLEDGRQVRLVGARIPGILFGPGSRKSRLILRNQARRLLEKLALSRQVRLGFGRRRRDRYDRLLAQVFTGNRGAQVWLQGRLVDDGLARVYSWRSSRACIGQLLKREAGARERRRGLWQARQFRVRRAKSRRELYRALNSFQIVTGNVFKVGRSRRHVYLNFEPDWRRDFTAMIAKRDQRLFTKAGIDLTGLAGRRVRIRGWLESWNGPLIRVTHPEQIEILDKPITGRQGGGAYTGIGPASSDRRRRKNPENSNRRKSDK